MMILRANYLDVKGCIVHSNKMELKNWAESIFIILKYYEKLHTNDYKRVKITDEMEQATAAATAEIARLTNYYNKQSIV